MSETNKSTISTHIGCEVCGCVTKVTCFTDGYMNWQRGMNINKALPELQQEERDMLDTGICPSCTQKEFTN